METPAPAPAPTDSITPPLVPGADTPRVDASPVQTPRSPATGAPLTNPANTDRIGRTEPRTPDDPQGTIPDDANTSPHQLNARAGASASGHTPSVMPVAAVQLGGGVAGFGRRELRSVSGVGGYWDARVIFAPRGILSLEGAYLGAAHPVDAGPNAALVRNGFEVDARLNAPLVRGDAALAVFGLAGIGWSRFQLLNADDSTATFAKRADGVASVPVGGGFAFSYRHLVFDVRYTYRFTFQDALLASNTGDGQLAGYTVGAQLGYEF